jgi:translation elongation factor EF-Tu-like GTPase
MQKKPYFKAVVTYYSSDKGGLINPISSGFRVNLKFPFDTQTYIGIQTFAETELIFPGDSLSVDFTLVNELFLEKLYKGIDFEISDNSKIIGTGIVSNIYSIT